MLDKLEIAIRRYAAIVPTGGVAMTQQQADQIVDWLDRHVCELVAKLATRNSFRQRARWGIDNLCSNDQCEERRAVIAVESSLLLCAKLLRDYAEKNPIPEGLLKSGRLNEVLSGEVRDDADSKYECREYLQMQRGFERVTFLAKRPWRDLASKQDYFFPTSGYNLKTVGALHHANFLPAINLSLRVPGDFIFRCLQIRIDFWKQTLQRFFVVSDTERREQRLEATPQWNAIREAMAELELRIRKLRSLCFDGPEPRLRDSCVALLQVYAGMRMDIDLGWLGPVEQIVAGARGVRQQISGSHQWDIPNRIAEALIDVTEMVRQSQSPDELIEEMKSTHRLVLIEEQRSCYLDGQCVARDENVDWHARDSMPWELLSVLAESAMKRRSVDAVCLSNPRAVQTKKPPTAQAIKDRRAKLKKLITPELNNLIVDAGPGTYRLKLDPDDICLLGWTDVEQLEIVLPTEPRPSGSLVLSSDDSVDTDH
jgi:hypothetical protein